MRDRVADLLDETGGLPQRTIAMIAGCSQSTVSETKHWLRKQRAQAERRARREARATQAAAAHYGKEFRGAGCVHAPGTA
jgi:hypothetical protein